MKCIPYLIQRGTFRKELNLNKKGIDQVISFDYMGAAEFEWGALPKSLNRINEQLSFQEDGKLDLSRSYGMFPFDHNGKSLMLFCKHEDEEEVKSYLIQIAKYERRCKEFTLLDEALGYSHSKSGLNINFWWDIDNDWFCWVNNYDYTQMFLEGMSKSLKLYQMKEKNE